MVRALIIGSHGFCARHLASKLAESKQAIVLTADIHPTPPVGQDVHSYSTVDLGRRESVNSLVRQTKPDWVFNLAALTTGSFEAVHRTNLLGTVHLLDAVRASSPAARVLLVGSAAEYGPVDADSMPVTEDTHCRPFGNYGVSKYAATLAAMELAARHSLRVVVARPFNIIGAGVPESLVVGAVLRRAYDALAQPGDAVVKIGNLDTQRDFVDVDDVVRAYIAMLQGEFSGEIFNICSGRPVKIYDVVTQALANSPRPIRLEVDPNLVRPSDCPIIYGSYEKAHRAFGFEPTVALEDSLKRAWNHYAFSSFSSGT